MKPYILTTFDKHKMLISIQERDAIIQAINHGDKAIMIQDCLMSLAIAPEILPFKRWLVQENDRLKNSQKRICKKCLGIMDIESGCVCWNRNTAEEKNPLFLPAEIKQQLLQSVKSFPQVSELEIKFEEKELPKLTIQYVESNNVSLGYIDQASGEPMYS